MATKHRGLFRERGTYAGVQYDISAKTKKDLKEKLRQKFAAIDSGVISSNMKTADWIHHWFSTYEKRRVASKTYYDRWRMSENYIIPTVGVLNLKDVRPIHLQTILNTLRCSESYGHKIMQLIKRIFRDAHLNRLIAVNPAEAISLPKLEKESPRRAITTKERMLLCETALHHRGGLWAMLQLYCGLRPSEAAAIQKFDLMRGTLLHVSRAINRYTGEITDTKTASGVRDIPIPDALRDFIAHWKWWDKLDAFDFIITTLEGNVLRDGGQRSVWKSIYRMMDIANGAILYRNAVVDSTLANDFTPYCLRHTYCTDLQAAGVPINVAKELMGHSDISITSRIYTHSSTEAIQDAASKINALSQRRTMQPDHTQSI